MVEKSLHPAFHRTGMQLIRPAVSVESWLVCVEGTFVRSRCQHNLRDHPQVEHAVRPAFDDMQSDLHPRPAREWKFAWSPAIQSV